MKLTTSSLIITLSFGFQILGGMTAPQAQAGRYVLNQTPETIQRSFGTPLAIESFPVHPNIKSYSYSAAGIRRMFPDFPRQGRFGMTYVNNRVTQIWLVPNSTHTEEFNSFDPRRFFDYIFAYEPPIWQELQYSGGHEGFAAYKACLGDGVGISFTQYQMGFDNISMVYNPACEPPYSGFGRLK